MSRQEMPTALPGRRTTQPSRIQALTGANAILQADNTELERANATLKAANRRLEQKLKALQVAVTILLAISGGLGAGLVTGLAGATAQIAFSSAAGIFFGVIVTSLNVLAFMHR